MSLRLTPYPAYKDSGLPWFGKVPAHWDVRRQRNVADMLVSNVDKHTVEGELPVRLCNYVDVYKNDRITERVAFMRASASPADVERFRLTPGDVVITKDSESWNDIGVPALVEYSAPDLVCGYHLAILRPRRNVIHGPYLFRAILSQGVASQYHVSANGVTRYGLSQDAMKSVIVPLPPLDEQCAIARYLNHADRRMNRLVRAKRRLIELLNEQKQAIIHRAVTRGLDPNVRLKPSGTDWLGDVPEHWSVTQLYRVTDPRRPVMYGIVLPGPSVDEGVYIVKGGNCESGRLRPEYLSRTTFDIEARYARSRLRANDIVYAIRGSIGAAELVPPELVGANVTQDAARIAPGEGICPRWLLYCVRSRAFFLKLDSGAVGATIRGINIRDLKRADLAVPPIGEQERIVAHIDAETLSITDAIDRARREVDLLREYRTRLIADVVTGKLDVRGVALSPLDDDGATDEIDAPDGGDAEEMLEAEEDGDGEAEA